MLASAPWLVVSRPSSVVPPSPILLFLRDQLGLRLSLLLLLPRDRLGALPTVSLVPVSRDLAGQLPVAKTERQSQSQRDRSKQDGECRCDDLGGDAELLK